MGCGNSGKFNCGTKTEAGCTYYKGYLPKYSKLDKNCVVIEETTAELYKNQEAILKSIDTSKLTKSCIDYDVDDSNDSEEGKILIVEVLQKLQDEICEMKEESEDDNSLNIDFKCLVAPCDSQITSLKDLLQTLVDEVCKLKE